MKHFACVQEHNVTFSSSVCKHSYSETFCKVCVMSFSYPCVGSSCQLCSAASFVWVYMHLCQAWRHFDESCVASPQNLAWSGAPGVHDELLRSYLAERRELATVQDDGYFMQNVGHHLVAAKHMRDLKKLLTNAAWLESKLHSYGVASVVADYRRCKDTPV